MTSKLTRERLEKIKSWRETYGAGSNVMLPAEEAEELARIALGAMDSEPVAEVVSIYGDPEAFGEREIRPLVGIQQMPYGTKLYRHAQPASTVKCSACRGSGRMHEPGEEPGDCSLCNGTGRLAAQPAPVVMDERAAFNVWNNDVDCPLAGRDAKNAAWLAWQARAKLAGNSPVIPEGYVMVPKEPTEQMYDAGDRQMATKQVWDAMLAAAPQQHNAPQNIPEIIPGWIPVSERMPEPGILVLVYTPPQPGDYPGDVRIGFDYIDPDGDDPTYWFNHGESYEHFCCVACDGMTGPSEKAPYTHWMPLPAAPQEVKGE